MGGRFPLFKMPDTEEILQKSLDALIDIQKRNKLYYGGRENEMYHFLQQGNIKNFIENKCAIYGIGFNEDTLSEFHQHFLEFDNKLQKIWNS